MKLRFLGTGTSFGVPVVGCGCATCTSPNPRDRRTRHAALLEDRGHRVLIDTPPELRLQLLDARVDTVHAIWYTHCHADHVHGVDDLRVFAVPGAEPIPAYGSEACVATLASRFDYVFDPAHKPMRGATRPEARLRTVQPYVPAQVGGLLLTPLPVPHGDTEAYGFRAGDLGYITDAKCLPERTVQALRGVRVLVLNALWYGNPHPTHFTVEEAVEAARQIGAERTFLTHLSHRVGHEELERRLPAGILPAYDGLEIHL